jgi:diacylglycerol kinase family enzyme
VNVLFLVNPRSGARRRHDIESLIRASCGDWHAQILPCDPLDDVIPRAVAEGIDAVYAVGGDGTVHEVAKRLIGTPRPSASSPSAPATASPATSVFR